MEASKLNKIAKNELSACLPVVFLTAMTGKDLGERQRWNYLNHRSASLSMQRVATPRHRAATPRHRAETPAAMEPPPGAYSSAVNSSI